MKAFSPTLREMDDRELLREFATTRSAEAFQHLVEVHVATVEGAARRILGNSGQRHVEDVTQCVFILLAQQARRIPEDRPLIGWLYKVTHYACRNVIKMERRRREREAAAMRSESIGTRAVSEAEALLDRALLTLSSRDRDALLLHYSQDLGVADMARQMQVPAATAKKRLRRALVKLRQFFAAHGMAAAAPGALQALAWQPQTMVKMVETITAAATISGKVAHATTGAVLAKGVTHMLNMMNLAKVAGTAVVLAGLVTAGVTVGAATGARGPETRAVAAVPGAAASQAAREADLRARVAAGATSRQVSDAEKAVREKFLEVERFARLPAEEQAKGLEGFYREVAPRTLNSVAVMILSGYPTDILNRRAMGMPGGNAEERWAEQLAAAAPRMTAEEVADNLESTMWLNIGSYVRTQQVLQAQEAAVEKLVATDLDSEDVASFERGCRMVWELQLGQFAGTLLDVYIPDGPRAKAARTALIWIRDPTLVERLRAEMVRDPKTLARHAGLFQGPLAGEKADPEIAKLLTSADAELRYDAAYALMECRDATLAKPIASLVKNDPPRTQEVALLMAWKLPNEAFQTIRGDLTGALRSKEPMVKMAAIKAFGAQKDIAVAPVLREYLTAATIEPGEEGTIMQALNALTGTNFGFSPRQSRERNAAAVSKFDDWVRQHGGTVEMPDLI